MIELEQKLQSLLLKALDTAEKTGEFIIDQAPELLEEFYRWHVIKNSLQSVLFILPLIVFFKTYKKADFSYLNVKGFVSIFSGVSLVVLSIVSIEGVLNLIKITVAPKLYLIDYFL